MRVLVLYNSAHTHINTVFEHLDSFRAFSANEVSYRHLDAATDPGDEFEAFDAVILHYCLQVSHNRLTERQAAAISRFSGLKALFLQDEYDFPRRAWGWIRQLGIDILFTVVPAPNVARIYPPEELPGVTCVTTLTGYVPEILPDQAGLVPPSQRPVVVGYRGRPLPIRYGQLGIEKVAIGKGVKAYCLERGIAHDIGWSEQDRIYGPAWYEFMGRCRAMLGSESGSNVFDWDGDLDRKVAAFRRENPDADDTAVHEAVIRPLEEPGLMNQLSPRVFESIAMRSVLVLFEGGYSGVVEPGVHYVPLARDFSNLDEVFARLSDAAFVDAMAERAYADVIGSGRWSHRSFVGEVDAALAAGFGRKRLPPRAGRLPPAATAAPIRTKPADSLANVFAGAPLRQWPFRLAFYLWSKAPGGWRTGLRPLIRRLRGIE